MQKKISLYKTRDEEEIKQILCLNSDVYVLLLYNSAQQLWILVDYKEGQEQGRLILKNLNPGSSDRITNRPVVLFASTILSFGILAGDEIHLWKTFKSKPIKEKIRMDSQDDRLFFDANPVTFIRSMPNGSLLMAHKSVFSEAYFFSIAVQRLEGYSFSKHPTPLASEDYRHLAHIASVPCILDMLPYGDDFFIHTPGSCRDWLIYPAETSILIKMNQNGQVMKSRVVEKGRGVFSQDGNCLMIKPFENDSMLYFYDLNDEKSAQFTLDENTLWTPGTGDTRYIVTDKRIAAWDSNTLILSALYNMPEWCFTALSSSKNVG
ncbi:hypothetical protein EXM22_02535 [Oceanispirochaeta crateris]|uniref:Uncharacterized protein n=1 Tax=Oceanispirochaeta crateris TaxID=2518645 RepID=A0A5C1QJZ9_9SPIO|nr:hypothetical protein EXM22_02535 [Oceanispirochaeta crateris]